ncbi:MAG: hypothetical protein NDI75_15330 [Candidatus Didemnitutus sp.]|nr:hypothetical protein [Candidatus Didemnitutus sp.]
MTDLGLTNKELSDSSYYGCIPCCESDPAKKADWEKTVVYPTASFDGKQAELLGAEELALGEEVEITFRLRVNRLERDERMVDGKPRKELRVGFEFLAASDMAPVSEGEGDEAESEESGRSGMHMSMGADDDAPVNAIL